MICCIEHKGVSWVLDQCVEFVYEVEEPHRYFEWLSYILLYMDIVGQT